MTLAALVLSGVLRLLAEWQRRRTIQALLARVPEGTEVVLSDTPTGQSMRLGLASRQPKRSRSGA
jgi:hypothetical protein